MEIWKDIKGYEGKYKVSNLGNVKSVGFYVKSKNDSVSFANPCNLKPLSTKCGYRRVCLSGKYISIHRLVAQAFIPNPDNKRTVNHKNGIKTDNKVHNLEWNTHSENLKHAFNTGLNKGRSKIVLDTQTGVFYENAKEVSKLLEIPYSTVACWLNGNRPNNSNFKYV